jgi:uncharacterized protein
MELYMIFILSALSLAIGIIVVVFTIFLYYAFQGNSVTIEAKNYQLKGRLYGKQEKIITGNFVLFLSGWNPGKISITTSNFHAGYYSKKYGAICLTVALRGMGSKGDINKLTRADFLDDVVTAYDFLSKIKGVEKENITIVGESLGGYLACLLSTKRPARKIALRVPTDFPDDGFGDKPHINIVGLLSREWKIQKHSFNESYVLRAINEFKGDLLIVASENDKIVPFQTIENYIDAISNSSNLDYVLIKKADHGLSNPVQQWKYLKILSEWLNRKESEYAN